MYLASQAFSIRGFLFFLCVLAVIAIVALVIGAINRRIERKK